MVFCTQIVLQNAASDITEPENNLAAVKFNPPSKLGNPLKKYKNYLIRV